MSLPSQNQADRWNGPAGRAWVDAQGFLDGAFHPFEELLLGSVAEPNHAASVLDVGCGAGATTLAAARRVGPYGRCVGVDISEPLIAAARARAAGEGLSAEFIRADAQTYAFEPGTFGAIVSRFGVMFFEDSVRAFENLRAAAVRGASLRFIAWRSPEENPFMTVAGRAARPLLPNLPTRPSDAPGQFAFQDPFLVRRILEQSGWSAIDVRPIDVECAFPEQELVRYFTTLGPLAEILRQTDDATRHKVVQTVRPAFDPYVRGGEVRFTAACWMANARAHT